MIGKLIGGLAGAQAAKYSSSIGGPTGAVLGALAVPLISKMRLPTLLAIGAGAYVAKRLSESGKFKASSGGVSATNTIAGQTPPRSGGLRSDAMVKPLA